LFSQAILQSFVLHLISSSQKTITVHTSIQFNVSLYEWLQTILRKNVAVWVDCSCIPLIQIMSINTNKVHIFSHHYSFFKFTKMILTFCKWSCNIQHSICLFSTVDSKKVNCKWWKLGVVKRERGEERERLLTLLIINHEQLHRKKDKISGLQSTCLWRLTPFEAKLEAAGKWGVSRQRGSLHGMGKGLYKDFQISWHNFTG
jgi:hypothetical protein